MIKLVTIKKRNPLLEFRLIASLQLRLKSTLSPALVHLVLAQRIKRRLKGAHYLYENEEKERDKVQQQKLEL